MKTGPKRKRPKRMTTSAALNTARIWNQTLEEYNAMMRQEMIESPQRRAQ